MKRLLTWLLLYRGERLVRVKSWRPVASDRGWFEWPQLLIDHHSQRWTAWPVWDCERLKDIARRMRGTGSTQHTGGPT